MRLSSSYKGGVLCFLQRRGEVVVCQLKSYHTPKISWVFSFLCHSSRLDIFFLRKINKCLHIFILFRIMILSIFFSFVRWPTVFQPSNHFFLFYFVPIRFNAHWFEVKLKLWVRQVWTFENRDPNIVRLAGRAGRPARVVGWGQKYFFLS